MTLKVILLQDAGDTAENAIDYRRAIVYAFAQAIGGAGVIGATALQCVVNNGTSATPTVNVGAGPCIIAGTASGQGYYPGYNDGTFTVTLPTRDASHTRIDSIIAHARDNDADPGDAGGNNDGIITYVEGTPSATPVPPTLPDDCLLLGNVTVPIGTTLITIDDSVRVKLPANLHVNQDLAVDGDATVGGDTTISGAVQALSGTVGSWVQEHSGSNAYLGNENAVGGSALADTYAIVQNDAGDTYINATSGHAVHVREQNTTDLVLIQETGGVSDIQISAGLPEHTGTSELVVVFHSGDGQLRKVSSSQRYKHAIERLTDSPIDASQVVRAIGPATFVMNRDETETRRVGFIAEHVAEVFPQGAVYAEHEGAIVPEALDQTALVAVLWQAVRTLRAEVDALAGS